ncbi:prefoldin subunit 3-like [Salvelinus sp. IW2-2015]|uniref:prefoldin subunit 3-like n=1 Tax=Salvelinus sp. IW2-2015 TaxID=2691554 RepID=UPI0038D3A0D8
MATTIDSSNAVQATSKKHLGIPEAIFVEDVESFMKQPGNDTADAVLRKLDEQYQKYKYMELNLAQKKQRLKSQIPQIKQTLEILRHMQKKKETTDPMETHFLLADNVYCKASVPPTDKVCLWLGVGKYCCFDRLVKTVFTVCQTETCVILNPSPPSDMARVYNFDVKRRSKDNLLKSVKKS